MQALSYLLMAWSAEGPGVQCFGESTRPVHREQLFSADQASDSIVYGR